MTTTTRGRPPVPERRLPRIDVVVTPELRRSVRLAAAGEGVTLSEWVADAIREKLARRAAEPVPPHAEAT